MKAVNAFALFAFIAMTASAQANSHGIFPTRQQRLLNSLGRLGTAHFDAGASARVLYYGGPVIPNVKVYAVFWGNKVSSDLQTRIGGFFSAVTKSTYFDWVKEYNTNITAIDGRPGTNQSIGRGSYAGSFTITPFNTHRSLQDADLQVELDAQISAGALPKPDENTIFFIYFPSGVDITIEGSVSCQQFCAYHEGYVSKSYGNVYYGVMPDMSGSCSEGCGFASTLFDSVTEVTSHELMEAVTDPFPTPGDQPSYPQAWNAADGEEIGDLCGGIATSLKSGPATYTLQQEWQNSINSCAKGPYQSR